MQISEKRLEANRRNAQKSTGPKSPGGKFTSSQNAITHGLFAKSILLPGESADRFNALVASYINHFNPTSPDEFDLVEDMAANRWRIRRIWTLETASLTHEQNAHAAATRGEDPPVKTLLAHRHLSNPPRSLESLSRQEAYCERQYHLAADRLRAIRRRAEKSEKQETRIRSHQPAPNQQLNDFSEPNRTIDEPSTKPDQSPLEPTVPDSLPPPQPASVQSREGNRAVVLGTPDPELQPRPTTPEPPAPNALPTPEPASIQSREGNRAVVQGSPHPEPQPQPTTPEPPPPNALPTPKTYNEDSPKMNPLNVDLKQTLNLPRTNFSMKANLPQAEPKMLARWAEEDLYGQIRKSREGKPTWILHDGPPYANGRIHLGHAFDKTIKDFIVKSRTMAGFDSPYVPGWDCHGLPIEHKVDQELGAKKAQMSTSSVRKACRKYAEKFVNLQREEFKRLGVLGRWDQPYLTMAPKYQSVIAGAFVDFLDKGYVYKGLKPVNWCMHDRTALAEAEVEYADHTSPSVWVRFALTSDPASIDPALAGKKVYGLIWTTTPWTLPANLAIAFNPKYQYVAVEVNGDAYVVAADLLEATAAKCGWTYPEVLARFTGDKFEGTKFQHPFMDRTSVGILGDHVTLEQGTGAVHTAPGHGQEDYVVGMQYGLEVYCPVDGGGRMFDPGTNAVIPEQLLGKTVWEANPLVIEILTERGALMGQEKISHSYPHCWRCHNATIFRATDQWFIGMDNNDLRANALAAIKNVRWMPEWGETRISNMVSSRPDWCISRQRAWGVPIVVFYCDKCRHPLTDRKILDSVVELFATHSADIWYEKTAAELIPPGTACAKCSATEFSKENDILDVWFDSGSSHLATLNEEYGLSWPANFYMEGGDQYRGWFQSSLLIGVGLKGSAPFKGCATHGWALDGDGKAMHKSLGNVIAPADIIKDSGAEIIRLWTGSVDFTEDVRLSPTILTRLSEAYRKLRNTFRYMLGNLHDFDPARDAVPGGELHEIDHWVLVRALYLVAHSRIAYDEYAFNRVYREVYDFATTDLSNIYFDVLKDRLYTSAAKSKARRSAQTALYRLAQALVRVLAPILSFTTEEVWGHLGNAGSVHTAYFPEPGELVEGITDAQQARVENWNKLLPLRDEVLKSLEAARQEKVIGAPLEASVRLSADDSLYPLLEQYAAELPGLFIVSEVMLSRQTEPGIRATIERASGVKCERCWKYTKDVGSDAEIPTVCAFCASAVRESLAA